jgi:hypothetical protein
LAKSSRYVLGPEPGADGIVERLLERLALSVHGLAQQPLGIRFQGHCRSYVDINDARHRCCQDAEHASRLLPLQPEQVALALTYFLDAGNREDEPGTKSAYAVPIALGRGTHQVRIELGADTCTGTTTDACDGWGIIRGLRLKRVGP